MQALTLPASRGWHWLYEGYVIFRKNPLMLSLIVLSYWMLMLVVNAIPVLGQIVATLLLPAFSVSLMNACRLVESGGTLVPKVLFSGFQKNLRPLLVLGVVYLVVAFLILGASALLDGGALFSFFVSGRAPKGEVEGVLLAAQFALVLFAPLMMAYWYAPVLVAWHDLAAGKSLFFSFVACARNWRAFVTYSLVLVVFVALLPGLVLGVLASLVPGEAGFISRGLSFLVVAIIAPILYASFYVSYRDVLVSVDENA